MTSSVLSGTMASVSAGDSTRKGRTLGDVGSGLKWIDGHRPLWGLFALSLLLRAGHLATIAHSPFFQHLSLDPLAYDEWGMRIASGDWLGHGVFYQDPLYPYFLGAVYSIFGHRPLVAVAIQILLGATIPPAVFAAARPWLGKGAALCAALLSAAYAPSIYYEGLVLKTWMEPFFMAAALFALSRAVERGRSRDFLATGLLLGLGCLVRANFLLLLPLLAVWIVIDRSSGLSEDRGARSRRALALLAGAALVLGSTALRNRVAGGEWVLTTAQGGQNFYLGNNPLNRSGEYEPLPFVGANPKHEQEDFAREAGRRAGRPMRATEVSRYWYSEALVWIVARPLEWTELMFRKVRLFWGAYEVPDNLDYYEIKKSAPVLHLPIFGFGIVAPLGLVGAILLLRRSGWPRGVLLCLLVYSCSVILFYVFARYRMGMMPLLFPLAGTAVVQLASALRKGWTRAVVPVALLLASLAFVNVPVRATADSLAFRIATAVGVPAVLATTATAHFNLGVTYAREAQRSSDPDATLALAEAELREALRQETRFGKVYVELGKVLARRGKTGEAIEVYRASLRVEPDAWRTYHTLGLLYVREGNRVEAEASFRKAIEIEPRQSDSRRALEDLQGRQPKPGENDPP